MIGASLFLGGSVKAEVDYQGIAYLGGGDKIDLNNANIRAYLKVPGFYPSIASKIVVNGPFKSVADVYNIPGLTSVQKDIIKKSESRFLALDVKPEYEIDKINNGYVTTKVASFHFYTAQSCLTSIIVFSSVLDINDNSLRC
jgi:photosystem II PsbU protein